MVLYEYAAACGSLGCATPLSIQNQHILEPQLNFMTTSEPDESFGSSDDGYSRKITFEVDVCEPSRNFETL